MVMQRREEISVFNAVCVLAMILIHAVMGMEGEIHAHSGKMAFYMIEGVFGFLFEGFIFLSGLRLFLNRYNKMTVDTFYINRAVIVLMPYVAATIIYYVYFILAEGISFNLGSFFMLLIKGDMAPDMYFILVLFQIYLIMPVFSRLLKGEKSRIVLGVALVISVITTVLSVKYPILKMFCPQYLFFFIMCALAGLLYKEFKTVMRQKKAVISGLFIVGLVLYETAICLFDGIALVLCGFVYAFCAILFLFMIATAVSDRFYIWNFPIKQVDKSAYFIFLMHGLIIYLTDVVLNDKLRMEETLGRYGIRALAVVIATLIISVSWRYIRNVFLLKRRI